MSDDAINSALITLREKLRGRELERLQPRSCKIIYDDEIYERKMSRILDDPHASLREVEDLLDEIKAAYSKQYKESPALYSAALESKIKKVRAAGRLGKKNTGGRPAKYDWEGAIVATMAAIFMGDPTEEDRPGWHKYMRGWFVDLHGTAPEESEIRKRTAKIEAALKAAGS